MNDIELVGPEFVAHILGITEATLKSDLTRRPHSLPPRLMLPGRKRYVWVKEDVLEWIDSFRRG